MIMLSTFIRRSLALLLLGLFSQCQDVPPPASPLVYVSADHNDVARRPSANCAFRFHIANAYTRLDNDTQREAIRAGFALWQRADPNVGFLELPDRPELTVRFADPSVVQSQAVTVPLGLVRGSATTVASLRKESSGTHTILLSNAFAWTTRSLTKAVAYQVGLFLGMATSDESNSVMSPVFVGQPTVVSKADSVGINSLYRTACTDLAVGYLPLSFKVGGPVTKTIKLDKQGIVSIKASGQMIIGEIVGTSGPAGRTDGVGGFSFNLLNLNIVPEWNHAVLMYKLNNETNWRNCGPSCSFTTNGLQYVDLKFMINDADLTDNIGGYDVVVDYQ